MPVVYPDADSFFAALAAMAEDLRQQIIPLSDLERRAIITRILDDSDMVFGVWPEGDDAAVVGVLVIKGEDMMPPLEGFDMPGEVRLSAIPCVGRLQAQAARIAWEARWLLQQVDGEQEAKQGRAPVLTQ